MFEKIGRWSGMVAVSLALMACDGQSAPDKVAGFLESAAEKRAAGEHEAAVIELKNALQITPENAEARRRLGAVYLTQGRGAPAAKEFEKALTHGESSPALRADLARARLMSGAARTVLNDIAAPSEGETFAAADTRALYGLRAQALQARGEIAAAEALAERLLTAGGGFEARLAMAQAKAARGEDAAALRHVGAALDARPNDPQALWLQARSLVRTGDRPAALEVLQKARSQSWRPVEVDIALIELSLQQQDTETAWTVLADLQGRFGDDPRVQYFTALRALSEERHEDARRIADAIAGQYPNFAPAAYIAGAANLALGHDEIARSYLERFVNRNPDHRRGRALLAQAWANLGETVKARQVREGIPSLGDQARQRQYAAADGTADVGAVEPDGLDTPEGRRRQVEDILGLLREGAHDEAMAAAEALGEELPDSAAPGQLQGIVLWAQGERDAAIARLEEVLAAHPDTPGTKLNLARMHRARGDLDASLAVLKDALDAHPERIDMKLEAARVHAARNAGDKVQSLLESALEIEPAAVAARAYLARYHLVRGAPEAAIEVVTAAPGDQARTNTALLEVRGRAHQAQGDLSAALTAFDRLIAASPDTATGYFHKGETLLAMNRPGDAVAPLEQARERADPGKAANILLARALLQSGAGDQAERLIGDLEESYPEESDVAILRGNHALAYAQDPDAAVAAFEKALDLAPGPRRLLDLAGVLLRLDRRDAAVARLQDWRAANAPNERVDSTLAELYLAAGEREDATRLYESLVERAPETAAYHNNLAWLLGEAGRLDPALRHARTAVDLAPDDPGIRDTLGVVHLKRGEAEAARRHLKQAAEAAPDRADIRLNYAEALIAAGDGTAAAALLDDLAETSLSERAREQVARLRARVE